MKVAQVRDHSLPGVASAERLASWSGRRAACGLLAAAAACLLSTMAEAALPCRVVTIVVPFSAGASTDTVARALGEKVSGSLGLPVIIDNKPGAEGQIGSVDVMRAAPDGCRILMASSGVLSVVPYLRKQPPYNPVTDFTAIADIGRYIYVLYAAEDVPARNVQEFVSYVKGRPGTVNYATGSVTNQLAMSYIESTLGLKMTRVSYRGEPGAVFDLLAGRVQAMIGTLTIGLSHVKAGKLKAYAVMLPNRLDALPDVPSFEEAGIPRLSIVPWAGLFGPPGMEPGVVAELNKAFNQAMDDPDIRRRMDEVGFVLTPGSAADFAKLVADQHVVYGERIAQAGLEPQ